MWRHRNCHSPSGEKNNSRSTHMSVWNTLRSLGLITAIAVGISACESAVDPVPVSSYHASGLAVSSDVVTGETANYLVRLRANAPDVETSARSVMSRTHGKLGRTYRYAIKGFSASLTQDEVAALAADPNVEAIEREQIFVTQGGKPTAEKSGGKPASGTTTS